MFRKILTPAIAVLFFAGVLCSSTASAKGNQSLQIKGSDTMVNLMQAWVEEYMKKNPEEFVAVTGGGSGTGLASLINGTCDIAMSSRQIKPQEVLLAGKKGIQPKELIVALDGIVVVVNPANPVSKLTLDQLAGIFTGKIKNWKEVGGPDEKIVILSREVNSGTHVYFKEHVLRKGNPASREEYSSEALLLPSSQAIADEVAQNPSVIGYYGMGYASPKQKIVAIAGEPNGEFVYPDIDSAASGKYPISRPLFIYTHGEPSGHVRSFIDFVLSPEGQAIVSQIDFVPL